MGKIDIHLDKSIPIPLYYQLKEEILNNIKSGVYEQGSMVPKEQDLCDSLGISRTTVRQAITELVHEGWLYRINSKGTFVSKPKVGQDFIKKLEPFNEQISRMNMVPSTRIVELQVIPASRTVAEKLKIREGRQVIYLYRVRYADDEALVTIKTYLPYDKCSFVMQHDLEKESLYNILSRSESTRVCTAHRVIEAVEAEPEDGRFMDIKPGKPIHLFSTEGYNIFEEPIEFSIARYRGDRNTFDVNIYVENK